MRTIYFIDDSTGWAAGGTGEPTILKTDDAGQSWIEQAKGKSGSPVDAITFLNDTLGIAVCSKGKILRTEDGGANWNSISSGTTKNFHCIGWGKDSLILIGGNSGVLYRSTDQGMTWDSLSTNLSTNIYGIEVRGDSLAWAIGRDTMIFHSTDAGSNWNSQASGEVPYLHGVEFINDSTGWIVGRGGAFLRTTNGGSNWKDLSSSDSYEHFVDLHYEDKDNAWTVGSAGSILKSNDQGNSWSPMKKVDTPLTAVQFLDTSKGWAVGGTYSLLNPSGIVLRSTDGGKNWKSQQVGAALTDVHFVDKNHGWASSQTGLQGSVYHTDDGGQTWTKQSDADGNALKTIEFVDKNNGWAAGGHGRITHTNDGGNTWNDQNSFGPIGQFNAIDFLNKDTGWIGGEALMYTENGGQSWDQLSFSGTIHSIHFKNAFTGWCTTRDGEVYVTQNGGDDWDLLNKLTDNRLTDYDRTDTTGSIVVGTNGSILRRSCRNKQETVNIKACDSYSSPSGKTWSSEGSYQDTIPTTYGCDSIMTIHLQIDTLPDQLVVVDSDTLKSTASGSYYQWYECNNGSLNPLLSETDSFLVPSDSSQKYALKISKGGCNETSICYSLESVSLATEKKDDLSFKQYPNPAKNKLWVEGETGSGKRDLDIRIFSSRGRTIHKEQARVTERFQLKLNITKIPKGLYIIQIQDQEEGQTVTRKFEKQ